MRNRRRWWRRRRSKEETGELEGAFVCERKYKVEECQLKQEKMIPEYEALQEDSRTILRVSLNAKVTSESHGRSLVKENRHFFSLNSLHSTHSAAYCLLFFPHHSLLPFSVPSRPPACYVSLLCTITNFPSVITSVASMHMQTILFTLNWWIKSSSFTFSREYYMQVHKQTTFIPFSFQLRLYKTNGRREWLSTVH